MADNMSKEDRSMNMAAIKSISKLENIVSRELWQRGIRFRRNTKDLYGKPDFSIKKYKVVIFIDSCFWHQCPLHGNMPKNNRDFWKRKLTRNVERDRDVTNVYKENGWHILRVWEHELKDDFDRTLESVIDFINKAKNSPG
ncbi:very short patch repair endonuclease [Lentibacillus salinarum]|uniref:Very short patch repair endonuclease n=1 Tax=Lentibacillus salinarum TaxID=446820 RepID=A0ABW3ZST5_9BACI